MIEQLKVYKDFIIGSITLALTLGLYVYISGLRSQVHDLQANIQKSYIETANYKLEAERYKTASVAQNAKIKALEVQDTQYKSKLTSWRQQPPKIKYRTIYKIRKEKSNDCKKIKSVIDDIRHTDPSSL